MNFREFLDFTLRVFLPLIVFSVIIITLIFGGLYILSKLLS
jgi:hypothetical protein